MWQRKSGSNVRAISATCVVVAVAAASASIIVNHVGHTSVTQKSTAQSNAASTHNATTFSVDALGGEPLPQPGLSATPLPPASSTNSSGVHNSNTSSATVTVNGKTTQVSGDTESGPYNTSYSSDDGTTKVDISVSGSSSTSTSHTSTTSQDKEDGSMQ